MPITQEELGYCDSIKCSSIRLRRKASALRYIFHVFEQCNLNLDGGLNSAKSVSIELPVILFEKSPGKWESSTQYNSTLQQAARS